MPRLRRLTLVLLFFTALALASCGDDGQTNTTADQSATTASGPSSPSSTEGTTGQRAEAETLLARQADVPDDFTESPRSIDPMTHAAASELSACAGLPDPATVNEIEVSGPLLTKGEVMQVTSTATVVKTVKNAEDNLAAVTGSKFPECLKDVTAKSLREQLGGAALKDAKVETIDVGRFGDATVGTRITLTVEVGAQSFSVFQDTVLLMKGRFDVTLTFVNFGDPFDQGIERSVVTKVGKRLEALQ